ncbi:MAG: hypothetical protein WBG62_16460, partial [Cyclobacteriaceae bacterium]
ANPIMHIPLIRSAKMMIFFREYLSAIIPAIGPVIRLVMVDTVINKPIVLPEPVSVFRPYIIPMREA